MSWYASKKNVYDWATAGDGLRQHFPPREIPVLWQAIEKGRMGRVALGMLKILLERGPRMPQDALSKAVTKRELSDLLRCTAGHIGDAVNRINSLVVDGAREGTFARDFGLVWRNQYGVGIHPGLVDVNAAREMGAIQTERVTARWKQNTDIANAAGMDKDREAAEVARFQSLSPEQRRELLAMASKKAA